jgi:hypothetical protein
VTTSRQLAWLVLAPMLFACGEDAKCPAGSTKQGGVCVKGDPVESDDGEESLDGGTPADDGDDEDGGAGCPAGTLVYVDMDGDGVGAGEAHDGCPADGLVAVTGDCSPENALVFPGADEVCNGIDENCNEQVDEGVSVMLYADVDGDGHGDKSDLGERVCAGQPIPGKVTSHDDCDDDCAACSPENTMEMACDGKDENCDGNLDEGMTTPYFLDCDGDGYLSEDPRQQGACSQPAHPEDCGFGKWLLAGEEEDGRDCADLARSAFPGSTASGGQPVIGTEGYDYNCDMMETSAAVARCPFASAGADCSEEQADNAYECFKMAPPTECGAEAPALRCVVNFGLHPYILVATTKKVPCQ